MIDKINKQYMALKSKHEKLRKKNADLEELWTMMHSHHLESPNYHVVVNGSIEVGCYHHKTRDIKGSFNISSLHIDGQQVHHLEDCDINEVQINNEVKALLFNLGVRNLGEDDDVDTLVNWRHIYLSKGYELIFHR